MDEKRYNLGESRKKIKKTGSSAHPYEKGHREVSEPDLSTVKDTKSLYRCIPVNKSGKQGFVTKMSPGSIKISCGTKWSENGYIPSFKSTDEVLMKAAKRTYNSHGVKDR
ncbi:hypothetical protein J2128_000290 [Methanomicrobium sp. W14]|uniref:hypothetical protein n=1 Tax=Methanomicrobium sp. W14 TaxID=2817839 RepID=UPI001FD9612A|nr:hypothetical protein [Methanomicrobium sp. W14]MBP2132369.1 hypothetical protein [Methanomicrobium sp. W14]